MKSFLREPLLHFLIAGTLLFVICGYVGDTGSDKKALITVDSGQIERLKQAWNKQWSREPTEDELQKLIDTHIEEEVLYREALAMGLEKDDIIVRRRLAQKMSFIIRDISDQAQPDEKQLKAYYKENLDKYELPPRLSFTHVYFSPDRRGAAALKDARGELERLNRAELDLAQDRGDRFMLNYNYRDVSPEEAARLFGREFSEELFKLQPGQWSGPIRSGYGIHVVRVTDPVPARTPEFAEVKDRVRQDYIDSQRRKVNEAALSELKSRYKIVIDRKAVNPTSRRASAPIRMD